MKFSQLSWCKNPRSVAWLMALASLAGPAWPQQVPPQDLTKMSLEDLMNIEITSVSKRAESLSRTAAAASVITQRDIQQSGAMNLPDVLRMAPGVNVAQISANKWAISIRGMNGLYSHVLLVLLDGRIVYSTASGGVYWDVLDFPLEDIERIEVVRGPGGAMWGSNAVNGVVSIITKKASATRGTLAVTGGGTLTPEFGTLQYGAGAGKSTDYRVFAKYFNQEQSPGLTRAAGADGWHVLRGGFRIDSVASARDRLTIEGDLYDGREGITGSVLPSITAPALQQTDLKVNVSGGFLQGVWDHTYSRRSDTSVQLSYDRSARHNVLNEKRGTFDLTFQHHIAVRARHDIVWGFEARISRSTSQGSLFASLQPPDNRADLFGAFLQDEIALSANRLYLTLGAKVEHSNYSRFNAMPTARLAWTPTNHQTLWTAISRAVRTPSVADASIRLNFKGVPGPGGVPALVSLIGNPNTKDENLFAVEAGYRATLSGRLSIDVTAYYNHYTKQRAQQPAATFFESTPAPPHFVFPTRFQNIMHGEAHGWESVVQWRVSDRWTLRPGYAFEQVHMHLQPGSASSSSVSVTEGSAPVNSAQLRSNLALPHGLSWDASAYFVGRIANPVVPSYTRLDTSLSWQAQERLSLSLVGQNLIKDRHIEYFDIQRSVATTFVKRSAYAKATLTF